MTDNLSTVNICFVDLSKAFDNKNHYVLFKKLLNKRVPICLIKLLVNWYTKCFCFVKWGSSISRIFIPNTAVFGPTNFIGTTIASILTARRG